MTSTEPNDGNQDSSTEQSARLPVEATFQRTLLPVEAITSHAANMGSADLKTIVEGRDGRHYAVKTVSDGNGLVPASELFCYELACRVVIPTPPYSLISLPTGELAFGSVWEGGVVNGNKSIDYPTFIKSVLTGAIQVSNLKRFLSRLYAFDLFVNNVDRHWGNYLWRTSYGDSIIGLAFDFSRACFEVGHDGFEATLQDSKTQIIFSMLNVTKNYIRSEAANCLDDIKSISTDEISAILDNFPATWMSNAQKRKYVDWWSSGKHIVRINDLMKFI